MKNNLFSKEDVKKLREQTGAGVMACLKALRESSGNFDQAQIKLKESHQKIASQKADRETSEGIVAAYVHSNGRIGAIVTLLCETDFVARTSDFQSLAKELAMQVVAMDPISKEDFLKQDYIRDPKLTVEDLIKKIIAKTGENIRLESFKRLAI